MTGYSFQSLKLRNNMEKLPVCCVTIHPTEHVMILIESGHAGYKVPQNGPPPDMPVEQLRVEVDRINRGAKITRAQEAAMLYGSMNGFDKKLADPDEYDNEGELKK